MNHQQETTMMCLVSMFSKLTIKDYADKNDEQTQYINNTISADKIETTVTEQPIEQQEHIIDEIFNLLVDRFDQRFPSKVEITDKTTDDQITSEISSETGDGVLDESVELTVESPNNDGSKFDSENRHVQIAIQYRRFKANTVLINKRPSMDRNFINKNYQRALVQCVSECDGAIRGTQFGWTVDCYLAIRKLQHCHFKTEKKINKIVNKYFADDAECKLLEYTYLPSVSPMKSLNCIADTMMEDIYYEMLYHRGSDMFAEHYEQFLKSAPITEKVKQYFQEITFFSSKKRSGRCVL